MPMTPSSYSLFILKNEHESVHFYPHNGKVFIRVTSMNTYQFPDLGISIDCRGGHHSIETARDVWNRLVAQGFTREKDKDKTLP